jgi:hypothetical protein
MCDVLVFWNSRLWFVSKGFVTLAVTVGVFTLGLMALQVVVYCWRSYY